MTQGNSLVSTLKIYLLMEKLPSKHFLNNMVQKNQLRHYRVKPKLRNQWFPVMSPRSGKLRQFMAKQPKDSMKLQLIELATNETLIAMFPILNMLANISLSIPVSTASVERSFSQMKLLTTRLRNSLSDKNLSHLMKIAIESLDQLKDTDLEEIVNEWNRRRK